MQVKAIAEDRMKVMRRMGDLAFVQFNRDMRWIKLDDEDYGGLWFRPQ